MARQVINNIKKIQSRNFDVVKPEPKNLSSRKRQICTFYFYASTQKALKRYALEKDIKVSYLIDQVLDDFLKQERR
jgi:hypothetical protein